MNFQRMLKWYEKFCMIALPVFIVVAIGYFITDDTSNKVKHNNNKQSVTTYDEIVSSKEFTDENNINRISINNERKRSLEYIVSSLESRIKEINERLNDPNITDENHAILEVEKGYNQEKLSGYKDELSYLK